MGFIERFRVFRSSGFSIFLTFQVKRGLLLIIALNFSSVHHFFFPLSKTELRGALEASKSKADTAEQAL